LSVRVISFLERGPYHLMIRSESSSLKSLTSPPGEVYVPLAFSVFSTKVFNLLKEPVHR
jgi:hypothetical protein